MRNDLTNGVRNGRELSGRDDGQALPDDQRAEGVENTPERVRRIRDRNLATLAILLGLVVLFYLITIVRMGGA